MARESAGADNLHPKMGEGAQTEMNQIKNQESPPKETTQNLFLVEFELTRFKFYLLRLTRRTMGSRP